MRTIPDLPGFEVTASIDGSILPDREVSLVKITEQGLYLQHKHDDSGAYFIIVQGIATFLSGKSRKEVKPRDAIKIPRKIAYGFEQKENSELVFISIQSPSIRNPETGEEDIHFIDLV